MIGWAQLAVLALAGGLAAGWFLAGAPPVRARARVRVVWDPRERSLPRIAPPGPPVVYVMRAWERDPRGRLQPTDRAKIGWTTNVAERRRSIQTGAQGARVRVEALMPGDQDLERRLHKAFRGAAVDLEWFRLERGGEWRTRVEEVAGA